MRFGFDGKRATMNFRGLGNYSRGIIEGLLEYSANDIFLYTPSIDNINAKEWLEKNQQPRLHVRKPNTLVERKLHSLWRSITISGDLLKDKLDLYHGLSHEIPFNSRSLSIPKVVTIHDLIFMRYPEFFPAIDRITYKAKFKYSCENADLVLAICEQTKQDLIQMLGVKEEKILVHYQSCDPLFYSRSEDGKIDELKVKYHLHRPFILTVGAFEERKNQLSMIKAFASLSHSKDYDLVLIGNGKDYLQKCRALVKELNLTDRVHFFSHISFAELPLFYQAAKLFCFPSFFEGFGLPIVEALFSGTPVVTSTGSCFPESGGPYSLYADPYSVREIGEKIDKVLGDELLQKTMSSEGLKFVQKFHRKQSTLSLLECYKRLL